MSCSQSPYYVTLNCIANNTISTQFVPTKFENIPTNYFVTQVTTNALIDRANIVLTQNRASLLNDSQKRIINNLDSLTPTQLTSSSFIKKFLGGLPKVVSSDALFLKLLDSYYINRTTKPMPII